MSWANFSVNVLGLTNKQTKKFDHFVVLPTIRYYLGQTVNSTKGQIISKELFGVLEFHGFANIGRIKEECWNFL